MKLTPKRCCEILVILAYVGVVIWSMVACEPPANDGIGHKGRVTNRFHTGTGNNITYNLTIKDETEGLITFSVRKSWYDQCSPKEYYPGCRVKI